MPQGPAGFGRTNHPTALLRTGCKILQAPAADTHAFVDALPVVKGPAGAVRLARDVALDALSARLQRSDCTRSDVSESGRMPEGAADAQLLIALQ
jgi:hypothetical protein